MSKKVVSLLLVMSLVLGSSGVVSAADVNNSYTDVTTGSSEVKYEQASTYTVTVPKTITITDKGEAVDFKIHVEGDIAGDETVVVNAASNVELLSTNKNSVWANVTQDKSGWTFADIASGNTNDATCSISADGLSAGTWSGTLVLDITLQK